MPKAEYRSAQRSKQAIADAMILLAEEKPLFKITVTDVVTVAEISRSTFYTHFDGIDDLVARLEEYVVDELRRVLNDMKVNFTEEGILNILMGVSDTLEKDERLNKVLFNSDDSSIMAKLRTCFAEYMMDIDAIPAVTRASAPFNALVHFFAGGASNLYQAWFRGELSGSLQDVARMLCKMIILQTQMFHREEA